MGWGRGTRSRWRTGLVVSIAVSLCGCDDPVAPIVSSTELRLQQIYDAREWLSRVPLRLAAGFYARARIERFLADIALPEDVRARLAARLDAEDFVDELIPFLLFLQEMYEPPGDEHTEDFDRHLRAHFAREDAIPGITHDMFRWAPPADEAAEGGLSLPPGVARELVALYDVLFLQTRGAASGMAERLACEQRESGSALESTTLRAMPAVRSLVASLRDQLGDPEGDVAHALDALLQDDARLQAASAAVIRFVDQTVCRNYRFFAARAVRAHQLERWMLAELDAPGGGALWRYLERANRERRYGAVIVVDGLQGRLVEALARGRPADPFVQAIAAEQAAGGGPAPGARSLRAAAAQQTEFLEALASRGFSHPAYLPFFRALLADPGSAWIPVGVATTPTISVRNIPIVLTGAPVAGPGATGLPNFHFVDRHYEQDGQPQGRAYYFYGSDAVELVALTRRAGMRTLAERLPQLSSLSCTAQYDEAFHFGVDAFLNLGLGERLRDFGDRLCAAELERRAQAEQGLARDRAELLARRGSLTAERAWWNLWSRYGAREERRLARREIASIARREQRAMPELFAYYNPWPDHFAHFEGPFADEIIAPSGELNRLDYWLGRVTRAYRTAGVASRTVFGMAGDHGLTPVFHLLNPEVEVFDALRDEGTDFRVVKISSDEGEGPKLTNPFNPPSMKGIDVVVASTAGGNYMLDLFLDQDERFTAQPLASDLRAIRPLGASPNDPGIDLLAEITRRLADSLDYLAVRESACSPERCSVRTMGRRGKAAAEGMLRREGRRIHYAVSGPDLLEISEPSPYERLDPTDREIHAALVTRCLDADEADPRAWCDERSWRRLTSYTARPDSVVQLAHLYDSPRAGTVNLFPRTGIGYNSQVPGRHAGESFHEKNAFVAIWGEPLARLDVRRTLPRSAVNGSVPRTIFEWLARAPSAGAAEGFGFERLLELSDRP